MKGIVLLIIGLVIFSCNPTEKEIRPKEANLVCEDFYIQGQFKFDSYIFCGIVPKEVQYRYKNGEWKFWDIGGRLIAKGMYKLERITIDDEGGCPYEIIEEKIEKEKWTFFDEKGNQIEITDEIISQLESCTKTLNQ